MTKKPHHETDSAASMATHQWFIANEMRVLFCALITAHKRKDFNAFWATVEIAKTTLSKYANFNDDDWAVFRNDKPRQDEQKCN